MSISFYKVYAAADDGMGASGPAFRLVAAEISLSAQ